MQKILRTFRPAAVAIVLILAGSFSSPVSAQLFEVTRSNDPMGVSFSSGSAFDPVHDCYFVVTNSFPGPLTGRFLNRVGVTLGTVTLDTGSRTRIVRAAYSPDVSNGAGGVGAFAVIWQSPDGVVAQRVAFPGRLVGSRTTIVRTTLSVNKGGIAYSPAHRVFLVGLSLLAGIEDFSTRIVRLSPDLLPLGEGTLSSAPSNACANAEFPLACNEVDVEWNPIGGEFGVLYNQGRGKVLARVSGGGTVLGRTALGIPELYGALAVNTTTGSYLAVAGGAGPSPGTPFRTDGAEVAADGTLVGRGIITSDLDTQISVGAITGLTYSAASGTFLLNGKAGSFTGAALLLELNPRGVAVSSLTLSEFSVPFTVAGHPTASEWLVAAEPFRNYIIGTRTRFGGSGDHLPGCVTPDPFAALGGGTCYNAGWLPPGISAPAPPVIVPGGCIAPDPFAALGGGTCVSGGWRPPTSPAPPSPTPPVSVPGGCLTPDPFVVLGGGTCVNGGWLPPGMTAPTPPVVPGGCITPDPFVAIGGGVCANGGWRPRG